MNTIIFQKKKGMPIPFSPEDEAMWAGYKENQLTTHKVTGSRKQRSYQQLKMLHAALRTVVANTEDKNWNSMAKAKLHLKVELNYIDEGVIIVDSQNNVVVGYRSFGYDDLKHLEANKVFDRAWPILAGVIGVTVEELLENAEEK